jgi:hypothetical protein
MTEMQPYVEQLNRSIAALADRLDRNQEQPKKRSVEITPDAAKTKRSRYELESLKDAEQNLLSVSPGTSSPSKVSKAIEKTI